MLELGHGGNLPVSQTVIEPGLAREDEGKGKGAEQTETKHGHDEL